MSKKIDWSYRPTNYFWAFDRSIRLASDIKGAERKALYERLLREGETNAVHELLYQPSLTPEQRRISGSIHPAFMGGEYLPDCEKSEVEIARITIASTTQDVTCVYASRTPEGIAYRVVDEYDGDTLDGDRVGLTSQPMSLDELVAFFMEAWNLRLVLAANFASQGYPKSEVKGFVDASSSFYAEFGIAIQARIDSWLKDLRAERSDDRNP